MISPPPAELHCDRGPDAWRKHATERRVLHCLKFVLDTDSHGVVLKGPFRPDEDPPYARLLDSRLTWLAVKAGNTLMTRQHDSTEWNKHRIKSVQLYRVHPVRYSDLVVTCAMDWLEGVPAIHKFALGRYADGIPCDQRGYIPTAETRAFDLLWSYAKPTHLYDGYKTEYGLQWERDWPRLQAASINLTEAAMNRMQADRRCSRHKD